jgi:hypothetical protein
LEKLFAKGLKFYGNKYEEYDKSKELKKDVKNFKLTHKNRKTKNINNAANGSRRMSSSSKLGHVLRGDGSKNTSQVDKINRMRTSIKSRQSILSSGNNI